MCMMTKQKKHKLRIHWFINPLITYIQVSIYKYLHGMYVTVIYTQTRQIKVRCFHVFKITTAWHPIPDFYWRTVLEEKDRHLLSSLSTTEMEQRIWFVQLWFQRALIGVKKKSKWKQEAFSILFQLKDVGNSSLQSTWVRRMTNT